MTLSYYTIPGLGDTAQAVTATTQAALASLGASASAMTSIALALGVSVPVLGGVVAGLTLAVPYIVNQFKGCGVTCTAASRIADEAESYLKANLEGYLTGPRTQTSRAVALDTATKLLDAVRQGCSNPALQDAGRRCISERLIEGGSAPWCPTGTGCDWITLYLNPILHDVPVPDHTVTDIAGNTGGSIDFGGMFPDTPEGNNKMLIVGALALGVVLLVSIN